VQGPKSRPRDPDILAPSPNRAVHLGHVVPRAVDGPTTFGPPENTAAPVSIRSRSNMTCLGRANIWRTFSSHYPQRCCCGRTQDELLLTAVLVPLWRRRLLAAATRRNTSCSLLLATKAPMTRSSTPGPAADNDLFAASSFGSASASTTHRIAARVSRLDIHAPDAGRTARRRYASTSLQA
jgi:hypothetical protein